MLEFSQVSKHFGGLQVLQDVSFSVPQGGIFGLIGPNGAGKTTVFNLVTGLLRASGGSIKFNGQNLAGVAPHRITELGIARTFQNIRVFKEMTLLENVVVGMHEHLRYNVASLLFNLPGFRASEAK
ncbi:MAG: ABC transporter ATP-binding protein, partial [Proteobacteria bacterium]|nr:ABC transporter ATP-binding protein [Pseudomonadota bacterium]